LTDRDLHELCTGRAQIRIGKPDLQDDPAIWQSAWEATRDDALAYWIQGHPGSRPAAFWRFDCDAGLASGETEPELLHRLGLLESAELARIAAKTRVLAAFDRFHPPPDPNLEAAAAIHRLAARLGLVDPADATALGLAPLSPGATS
jgi:hypothetical protein